MFSEPLNLKNERAADRVWKTCDIFPAGKDLNSSPISKRYASIVNDKEIAIQVENVKKMYIRAETDDESRKSKIMQRLRLKLKRK